MSLKIMRFRRITRPMEVLVLLTLLRRITTKIIDLSIPPKEMCSPMEKLIKWTKLNKVRILAKKTPNTQTQKCQLTRLKI